MYDDMKFEKELHERFKEKKKSGDWFDLSEEAVETLKALGISMIPRAFGAPDRIRTCELLVRSR